MEPDLIWRLSVAAVALTLPLSLALLSCARHNRQLRQRLREKETVLDETFRELSDARTKANRYRDEAEDIREFLAEIANQELVDEVLAAVASEMQGAVKAMSRARGRENAEGLLELFEIVRERYERTVRHARRLGFSVRPVYQDYLKSNPDRPVS